jgi:hypothetical protein
MKETITYIYCDNENGYNNEKCRHNSKRSDLYEFIEYKGKDYCDYCLEKVKLVEQGLEKCKYCSNGKVSRDRMSSMGYYDDPKDYDFRLIYDCGICKGKGFIEIKKEQKTLF